MRSRATIEQPSAPVHRDQMRANDGSLLATSQTPPKNTRSHKPDVAENERKVKRVDTQQV